MEKKEWYVSCIETMKGTNKRIRATLKNMIYGMKGIEYYGETSEDDAEINRAILKGHADALDLYIEIENTYYGKSSNGWTNLKNANRTVTSKPKISTNWIRKEWNCSGISHSFQYS